MWNLYNNNMRSIKFIGMTVITLFMSVAYFGCSSDDENMTPTNPFVGTWSGEAEIEWISVEIGKPEQRGSDTYVFNFTFEANSYGTYLSYKKEDGKKGTPKGFSYKTRGGKTLSLYWNNRQEDGDSTVFNYTITSNTLHLELIKDISAYDDRVRKLELKKQ